MELLRVHAPCLLHSAVSVRIHESCLWVAGEVLAAAGGCWLLLAMCWRCAGGCWPLLAAAGRYWLLLADAGEVLARCWPGAGEVLAAAGCCWLLLAVAGCCWLGHEVAHVHASQSVHAASVCDFSIPYHDKGSWIPGNVVFEFFLTGRILPGAWFGSAVGFLGVKRGTRPVCGDSVLPRLCALRHDLTWLCVCVCVCLWCCIRLGTVHVH